MSITIKTHNYSITRNTTGGREPVKFIVLHYTATNKATAANEIAYFGSNPAATNASADFFVDDNEIWQYNNKLDSRYTWAVGVDYSNGTAPFHGRCTNANSISIEMSCFLSAGRWYIGDKTYQNALELTKFLIHRYGVPAENVIRHYDVCGKLCPNAYGWLASAGSDDVWKRFKNALGEGTDTAANVAEKQDKTLYRVRRSANDARSQIGAFYNLDSAKALADKNSGYSVFNTSGKAIYTPAVNSAKKTVEQLAREVIAGRWGNGSERKNRLTEAGYSYAAVQAKVNELLE